MPCKHYKDALIEAAGSGVEPQDQLRAHLESCDSCRAAFVEEQNLFASIDAGLHATVNAEVPVSLLPRVRRLLDEEGNSRRSWITNKLVFASAAVLIVAFFAVRAIRHTNVGHRPVETATKTSVRPLPPPSQKPSPIVVPPVEKKSLSPHQLDLVKKPLAPERTARRTTGPEVLVPHDQEILLKEYAVEWSLHKRTALVPQDSDATIMARLQVAPIQIDELGVKLLAEEKQQ
jgi:hypothetical protein